MPVKESKAELLMGSFRAQTEAARWMFESNALKNAGDLANASLAYNRLISALEKQLELAAVNNQKYPESPLEIDPIVSQLVNALLTEADVVEAAGDLAKAEEVREMAMALSDKYFSAVDAAERQRQRASSLIAQGRFHEALVSLTGARDLLERRGDKLLTANVTATLAGILEWLGDFERARSDARRALDLIGPLPQGSPPTMLDILERFAKGELKQAEEEARIMAIAVDLAQLEARVNRRLGKFEEAEKGFLDIAPRLPADIVEAGIGFQLAAIRIDQGRYQEGLDLLSRIEAKFVGLVRPKLGVLWSYKAEAMLRMGNARDALGLALQACNELVHYHDSDSLWRTKWRQGRALRELRRPQEALSAFVQAADTVDHLRKAPLGYRLDSLYLKDKFPLFIDAVALAAENLDGARCCSFIELVKSRGLTAALHTTSISQNGRNPLDQQLDELSFRLDALEFKTYAGSAGDEIEEERNRLSEQRTSLLERRRYSEPRWRSMSEPPAFEIDELTSLLKDREQAALTLFVHDDELTAVLVSGNGCQVAQKRLSDLTNTAVNEYCANLQADRPDPRRFDPSFYAGLIADQIIPCALLDSAVKAKSLVVSPHGLLHLIPWAGLTFAGKRLFEYLPVGILPNLSCICALQTQFAARPSIFLIGNPDYGSLPQIEPLRLAGVEIESIAKVYGNRVIGKQYTGKEATEERFWSIASAREAEGSILHVVSHGDFATGEPMNSGLMFANGRVDATELVRRRLAFDEVILSACSTGCRATRIRGITLSGDDIVGLPGALLEAGARSILVSIPESREDASSEFMTIYHEFRSEGLPPLTAMQQTQIRILENPVYDPYLWIGLTVYGCH
jgi:CHAT domain-containing protein